MIMPTWFAVRSLYSLQNAMMLTPCGPSAVPIGGAGLAFPAGICSLTTALTRFAILLPTPQRGLDFLDLQEIQNYWCLATEERNEHRHFIAVHINIADSADEFSERPIDNTYTLTLRETDFGLWFLCFLRYLLQDRFYLMLLKRNRASTRPNKASDTRRITYNIPGLIAHNHLHQHIAGEDLTLHGTPLALLNLHLFLHGHDNPEDFVTHIH